MVEPLPTDWQSNPELASPTPKSRPVRKRLMHLIRRGHLYLGLFLFPWAVLYGVTGFLFNHPTVFSDVPMITLESHDFIGTPMESPLTPDQTAARVVAALNKRDGDHTPYTLIDPETARYTRAFAFATVRTDEQEISVILNVDGSGGRIRIAEKPPKKAPEPAPFAVGGPATTRPRLTRNPGDDTSPPTPPDRLVIEQPLHERVEASVPTVLQTHGLPADGEVTVTSVPDLIFLMDVDGDPWRVTFNAKTGHVEGVRTSEEEPTTLSTRRFLTRMHLAHGYPSSMTARWFWAIVVDLMAFVMVFWGLSGLLMWMQIKATRPLGVLVLMLSGIAATLLAIGMHEMLMAGQ